MASFHPRLLASRLGGWARLNANKPWLPPALTAFPATDFVLPFMPNQLLLVGLSMLVPARWPVFAFAFSAGTAIAGAAIAFGIQAFGVNISGLITEEEAAGTLAITIKQFQSYGLLLLAGVSLLPWTPRLSVIACALVGFSPLAIFVTLLVTRLVPSSALGIAGANGFETASRVPLIRNWLMSGRGLSD